MSTIPATFDKDKPRFEVNPQDLYITDPRLVEACLRKMHLHCEEPYMILDVGCGTGNWGRGARDRFPDARLYGVDLVDRMEGDDPYDTFYQCDFLELTGKWGWVIGNPPFSSKTNGKLAADMIVHGIDCLRDDGALGFILKTEAVHSQDRFNRIFSHNPPNFQYVCVQRPGWYGDGSTNTIEYSFFIWQKKNSFGCMQSRWLSWR